MGLGEDDPLHMLSLPAVTQLQPGAGPHTSTSFGPEHRLLSLAVGEQGEEKEAFPVSDVGISVRSSSYSEEKEILERN